jgi:hypothetical protein
MDAQGQRYTVKEVPLHQEQGYRALAVVLPELLEKYELLVHELALDSACMSEFKSVFYLENAYFEFSQH